MHANCHMIPYVNISNFYKRKTIYMNIIMTCKVAHVLTMDALDDNLAF